jgi:hypothetical protein
MNRLTRRETIQCLALSAASSLRGVPCSASEHAPTRVQEIEEWPPVDVLVCGGGPAGIAAALMAARLGAKTLLVERYGRLGGMAVQAMVGPLMGDVHSAWVDGILEHLGGRRVDYEFIDLKYAELLGQAQGVSAAHPLGKDPQVKPYDIPYDCLVPERIDGLLVAGRCISGTHEAMASYRVQVIAMATGVAAGVAAAQAAQQGIEPRAVDVSRIQSVVFQAKT